MARRRKSFGRRLFIWLASILAALLVILSTLVWWIVMHPEDGWALVQRYLLPPDLKVTWSEMHFVPVLVSWHEYKLDWSVKGLNIEKADPLVRAPVEEISVRLSASLFKPRTGADFEKVTIHAPRTIRFQPGTESSATAEQSFYEQAMGYRHYFDLTNSYATMKELDVSVTRVEILPSTAKGAPLVLAIGARKPASAEHPTSYGLNLGVNSSGFKLDLEGTFDPARISASEGFLDAHLKFDGFGVNDDADLSLSFSGDVLRLKSSGPLKITRGADVIKLNPELLASLEPERLGLNLSTGASGLPAPLKKLDRFDLRAELPQTKSRRWSEDPGKISLEGPLDLFFVDAALRASLEEECGCKVPGSVKVGLAGRYWMKPLIDAPEYKQPVFDVRLNVESVKNKLFAVSLAGNFLANRDKSGFEILPKLDSEAHILSYRGVRNILDRRGVIIPAPFDKLEGTVDLVAKSSVGAEEGRTQVPVVISTNLASEHQRVDVTTNVRFDIDRAFKNLDIYIKVLIAALEVQLPPLDPIAGMPKVVTDARIKVNPPKPEIKRNDSAFKMQIYAEAKTAKPGAIKLLTAFAKPGVPITVDVTRALDKILAGSVQLEPFDLQYMRRVVHVEQLRLLMDVKDQGDFPVDGRLRVDQSQYKVFIDIGGTLRKPLIRFSSEPELSKKDIISVLLFDRVAEESGDAETAGSFESAVADRAIGLFGIWAFASTPIRSFSYNPVTKVYAATVQLADGLTAGIGTDWEEAAHLEVRKRVSRRWVLTASFAPSDASGGSQVGKLVLQWEKRF